MAETIEAGRDGRLGFGIFLAPFHPVEEDPTAAIDRDLELVQHLDHVGYDEAWIGEHHSGGYEIIASPEVFIAAAAERTKRIRIGTGVVSLPYHHPFMIADRMVQLDHMTRGRAMFGVGPGALAGDAYRMGIDPRDQRRMMNEAIDVIVPLVSGERVSAKTDWFELRDAQLQLPSYSRPRIEMAVASAASPAGALAAGRHGLGMLSIGGTSDEAMAHHVHNWGVYEEAAAEHDQVADRANWRLVSFAHIAETREQARENVRFGIESWAQYFRDVATFPVVPADIDDAVEFMVENKLAAIGTPDDAIAHIEKLLSGTGGFGTFLEFAHNWADFAATKRHYELMARYVIPHFQQKNELRRISYDYSRDNREAFVGLAQQAVQTEIEKLEAKRAAAAGED
jgi:limonene 1,2-monooxygenase